MKKIKYLVVFLVIASSVLYYSCDDAGVISSEIGAGVVVFTQITQLQTLGPNDDLYCLWVLLTDSLGTPRPVNLGSFNVLSNGSLVDASGNPVTLAIPPADTIDLVRAIYSVVTIQPFPATFPGTTVILGGPLTVFEDSVVTQLRFNDSLALGTAGDTLIRRLHRTYILNTPSNAGVDCKKGIWFTNESGASTLPQVALNPVGGWQFRGWVRNKITNEAYTTGIFYNALIRDNDGAGLCAGTDTGYNAPGEDWILGSCGTPITNLANGNFEVFIVLEPNGRSASLPPFNLKLYWQNIISPSLDCVRADNLFSQSELLPNAKLRITR